MELVKVKTKKVTAKDIQGNLLRIKDGMNYINGEINATIDRMKAIDRTTESGRNEYAEYMVDLQQMKDIYTGLQEEMEKEYTILKKYKDSRFYVTPEKLITIAVLTGLSVFIIALDRESPKASKLVSMIVKPLPMRL